MKTIIILEDDDIKKHIADLLAVKGLRATNDIVLKAKKKAKGEETRYEVVLECEPCSIPDACPLCNASQTETVSVAEEPAATPPRPRRPAKRPPREFPVDSGANGESKEAEDEDLGPLSLDPELGETTDIPAEIAAGGDPDLVVVDGEEGTMEDGEFVPSMASLVGSNDRLRAERERELAKQRKNNPKLMGGESTRPPKPGS